MNLAGRTAIDGHRRAANKPAIDDRLDGFVPGQQRGASGHRVVGDHLVEFAAARHVTMLRIDGVAGPLHLHFASHARRPQSGVSVELAQRFCQPHLVELVHRTRCQRVATGLLPRKRLALHNRDVVPMPRQPIRSGCTRGPAAHDQDISSECVSHATHRRLCHGTDRTPFCAVTQNGRSSRRADHAPAGVPALGTVPISMMPLSAITVCTFANVAAPVSRATYTGDSSAHQSSNSGPSSATPPSA